MVDRSKKRPPNIFFAGPTEKFEVYFRDDAGKTTRVRLEVNLYEAIVAAARSAVRNEHMRDVAGAAVAVLDRRANAYTTDGEPTHLVADEHFSCQRVRSLTE